MSILSFAVAKDLFVVEDDLTVFEPLAVAPCDVSAHAFTFCLGETCMDGHQQFAVALEGIDVLFLEDDADAHQLELADELDALCGVSGEAGYGLGDDVVDLAPPAIPDHSLELVTLVGSCA